MARITEAWTDASEFSCPYLIQLRIILFPSGSSSSSQCPYKRKLEKNIPRSVYFRYSLFSHTRSFIASRRRVSIDRIPRESIVEIIGVTREPDDGPVLSGTFALCVALSCNTSAQPDFTGGEFRQRRDAVSSVSGEVTRVSTFRRSSICITARQREKRERVATSALRPYLSRIERWRDFATPFSSGKPFEASFRIFK